MLRGVRVCARSLRQDITILREFWEIDRTATRHAYVQWLILMAVSICAFVVNVTMNSLALFGLLLLVGMTWAPRVVGWMAGTIQRARTHNPFNHGMRLLANLLLIEIIIFAGLLGWEGVDYVRAPKRCSMLPKEFVPVMVELDPVIGTRGYWEGSAAALIYCYGETRQAQGEMWQRVRIDGRDGWIRAWDLKQIEDRYQREHARGW
jgi:hypothetical protein